MAGDIISVAAPAKINLYLKITGRRDDGYHYLLSLMHKVDLYDHLEFKRSGSGINLSCPGTDLPKDEGNLVFRAARLFFETVGDRLGSRDFGVTITLNKNIPVAAGLGGGSSDAAATLRGLNEVFEANCSKDELLAMAGCLGADVPQFILDWPVVWAAGIGDRLLEGVPLSGYKILLVNPGISVSTKWVYENFALTAAQNLFNLENSPNESVHDWSDSVFLKRSIRPDELYNDLERVTAAHHPAINALKKRLLNYGASATLMSGSGSTVFGLFHDDNYDKAMTCFKELRQKYSSTYLVNAL